MRIVVAADWHLDATHAGRFDPVVGMHTTWVESFGRLQDIVNLCNEVDADILLVAGDVYDTGRPVAEAVALTLDRLKQLVRTKVIFVNGNHDQQTVLMSHRTPIDAYLANQPFTLHVSSEPEVLEVDGVDFLLMPWIKVAGVSQEDQANRDLSQTIQRLGERLGARPSLLGGHLVVDECTFDSGRRGSEMGLSKDVLEASVPVALLDSLPTARNVLGHIHRGQILTDKSRYVGAPYKVDFGEYGHVKGVEIIDLADDNTETHLWHPLPGRELWNLDATKETLNFVDLAERVQPDDRVKLQLGWDEDEDPVGMDTYLKVLKSMKVSHEVYRKPRPRISGGRRISGLSTSASPLEALRVYMDQQSIDAEQRDALLAEFAELM